MGLYCDTFIDTCFFDIPLPGDENEGNFGEIVDRQIKQSKKPPLAAWRVELGKVIRVPAEKERIARALGVSEITLWRWTNTM
jgi:hypothetical protein